MLIGTYFSSETKRAGFSKRRRGSAELSPPSPPQAAWLGCLNYIFMRGRHSHFFFLDPILSLDFLQHQPVLHCGFPVQRATELAAATIVAKTSSSLPAAITSFQYEVVPVHRVSSLPI
ncbi:hypothetical protein OIU84_016015 [Salix udensis]|uniref:Uncharacterized protein n=1 Tax=Salix udensis TaxID=889485 RepID=A0AAD6NP41_9ROSI|nr:hypothetical protein OIU84_016015 [Salix udensis]